tara:strand:+ start:203 stop:493 length:291 start_codon:yes stop_codon:yes gene_type:complete
MDSFYSTPLWLQIYIQCEQNPLIRGILRMTTKNLNNSLVLKLDDYIEARKMFRLSWYYTTRDFELIRDDSEESIKKYNYYNNVFISASLFLTIFTD